ncbi:hypothetical protein IPM62_03470 [Candidatus Woesebacteria bacterium]|nr:MAG: hypothetical protein IPM62_03470 [Candidatus Woesebacteria bacterium]
MLKKQILISAESPKIYDEFSSLGIPCTFRLGKVAHNPSQDLDTIEFAHTLSSYLAQGAFPDNNTISIGITTIVVVNNHKIKKPTDENNLYELFILLSKTPHTFVTSFTLLDEENNHSQSNHKEHVVENFTNYLGQSFNNPRSKVKNIFDDMFYKYSLVGDLVKEAVSNFIHPLENANQIRTSIPVYQNSLNTSIFKHVDKNVYETTSFDKTGSSTSFSIYNVSTNASLPKTGHTSTTEVFRDSQNIVTQNDTVHTVEQRIINNEAQIILDKPDRIFQQDMTREKDVSQIEKTGIHFKFNMNLDKSHDSDNNLQDVNKTTFNKRANQKSNIQKERVKEHDSDLISNENTETSTKTHTEKGNKQSIRTSTHTKKDFDKRENIINNVGKIVELYQWFSQGDFITRFIFALIIGLVISLVMFGIAVL